MSNDPIPEQVEVRRKGRQRLIGAIVLALLAVVFVPMALDPEPRRDRVEPMLSIPPREGAAPLPLVTKSPEPAAESAKAEPAKAEPPKAESPKAEPPTGGTSEGGAPEGGPGQGDRGVQAARSPAGGAEAGGIRRPVRVICENPKHKQVQG